VLLVTGVPAFLFWRSHNSAAARPGDEPEVRP
jgi:hypothetical protein